MAAYVGFIMVIVFMLVTYGFGRIRQHRGRPSTLPYSSVVLAP